MSAPSFEARLYVLVDAAVVDGRVAPEFRASWLLALGVDERSDALSFARAFAELDGLISLRCGGCALRRACEERGRVPRWFCGGGGRRHGERSRGGSHGASE